MYEQIHKLEISLRVVHVIVVDGPFLRVASSAERSLRLVQTKPFLQSHHLNMSRKRVMLEMSSARWKLYALLKRTSTALALNRVERRK
ncbi:hypothetical protein HID58_032715 [Brassica napus]|uniref:Uncharacterized protein n=1 Tax=Brassica napus TaxID=3708 RepID=A0ABQ8BX81_BRANA|nr:hypothetical protein HID58_032715 [Brassica napus]